MKGLFLSTFLSLGLVSYSALGQTYHLTDLGAALGPGSYAQGINNNGQVVGYWSTPQGIHAFLYDSGQLKDLGILGGTNIYALTINDVGQVAGFADTGQGLQAFLYQNGSLTNLGNLGGINSYAYGINGQGKLVGYIDTPEGARAFLYDTGTVTDLGTLGGTNAFAFGVNSLMQVAGSSLMPDNVRTHAFLWQAGVITNLNLLLPLNSGWELMEARGINDKGQIVGWGLTNNQEHGFLYAAGSIRDLGVLPGATNSYAFGLNSSATAVGASSVPGGTHAVLWRKGLTIDLNTLIDANAGWEMREARGINDVGQIVGWGVTRGEEHAFLLTPTRLATPIAAVAPSAGPMRLDEGATPTVTITNPLNTASFTVPTDVAVYADAYENGGTITQVQFYAASTLLGTATTSPYSVTWSNVQVGTYALTAVATDDGGISATSAVVNIAVTLPATDALKLWLKADAGVVLNGASTNLSTWQDQSGLSNNAIQSSSSYQPVWVTNALNGLPVVRFDGVSQYLNLPSILNSTTQAETLVVLKAASSLPSGKPSLWRMGGSGSWSLAYPNSSGQVVEDFGSAAAYNLGVPLQPLDQYHIYEVAAAAGSWKAWFGGLLQSTFPGNTYGSSSWSYVLGRESIWGYQFAGDVAEVLVFSRTLADSERTALNAYLNLKYGLTPPTPATPTNLVATAVSPTQINVSWSEALDQTTQLSLERKTGSNGVYTVIAQLSETTSYFDTNLTASTTYYYRVRAINLNSWSPYSNEGQATTFASGSDLPLTNLVLWLKADTGLAQLGTNTPVTLWLDQSGRGNNAVQGNPATEPAWVIGAANGFPVVRFSGSQYLVLPNVLNATTQAEALVVLKAANSLPPGKPSLWRMGGSGSWSLAYPNSSGQVFEDFGSATAYNLGVPLQPLNQYHIYELAAGAGDWKAWVGGLLQSTVTGNTYGTSSWECDLGRESIWGYAFAGDLAEVMIFNRKLEDAERAAVNGYLNQKYALAPPTPAKPTNLVATAVSSTQINVSWKEALDQTTQLSLERKSGANGAYAVIAQLSEATSYLDTNLTAGTTYYYRVRAINLYGWSDYSNEGQAATFTSGSDLPLTNLVLWLKADTGLAQLGTNTPVGLWLDQSGRGNNAVQLTSDNEPVWVSGAANGYPVVRFNGSSQHLILPSVLNGTTQAEALVILKAANNLPSGKPALWRMGGSGSFSLAYPNSSGHVVEDFGSATAYDLGVPVQPVNQYHLYEVAAGAGSWNAWIGGVLQGTSSGNTYSTSSWEYDLGRESIWTYAFAGDVAEVMIFNRKLADAERAAVNGYLNQKYALTPPIPATPSNLVAAAVSPTQINITWKDVLDQTTQLSLERKTGSNGLYAVIAQLSEATSYLDTNLTAGTTYYYRVRAINLYGWSDYSNEGQATTFVAGPDMPLTNLVLWLKADAGLAQLGTNTPVGLWLDQSGRGNHATQTTSANQPLWVSAQANGYPVVRFDGSSQHLLLPNMLTGTTQAETLVVLKAASSLPSGKPSLWRLGASGSFSLAYPNSSGQVVEDFGSTAAYNLGVPTQPLNQYHIYELAAGAGSWKAWFGGLLQSTQTANTYGLSSWEFDLGREPIWGYRFAGDIAEVLIFDRTLTDAERAATRQYLLGKYAMIPSVSITSPTNNAILLAGSDITLDASATVGCGAITKLEFLQGTTSLGSRTSPPYRITLPSVAPGTYAFTARADTYTFSSTSSVVNVRVDAPPVVSIVSPANNTVLPPPSPVVPVNLTITAVATDDYGIRQVQLFQGTNCLAILTNAPYSLTWTNLASGSYTLSGVALANDGFSSTSQPVNVMVDVDSDQDGIGDLQEYLYGSDPNGSDEFRIWLSTPSGRSNLP
jgi:probable HAF family extracellular repeat protein